MTSQDLVLPFDSPLKKNRPRPDAVKLALEGRPRAAVDRKQPNWGDKFNFAKARNARC